MSSDSSTDPALAGHHAPSMSISSVASLSEFVGVPAAHDDVEASPDATRIMRDVEVFYAGPAFNHSLRLVPLGAEEALEMEGDAENGYKAVVSAAVGQDLLYRFEVDGELQASEEAPIMQLNGEEWNVMSVPFEKDPNAAPVAASPRSAAASAKKETPHSHRREKSAGRLQWDRQASRLIIGESDSSSSSAGGATTQMTPARKSSTGDGTGPSPRFVDMGAGASTDAHAPAVAVPDPEASVSEDDDEDDVNEDGTPATAGGPTKTQRKNQRHREKAKQALAARALLSPSGYLRPQSIDMRGQQFQTPQRPGGPSGAQPSPMINQHAAMMEINRLKMINMQSENRWKEAWIAHELQSFQTKEAERNALKATMNEERSRWLAKLKDFTAEIKTVRDENLQLKSDLAAAAADKKIEKSVAKRNDKFKTMQKNMLNDEMLVWIQDKNKMTAQIETLNASNAETVAALEATKTQLASASSELSALTLTHQAKERELAALVAQKSELESKLAQGSALSGAEVTGLQSALSASESKAAATTAELNAARSSVQTLEAQLAASKSQLESQTKALEAQRAAGAQSESAVAGQLASTQAELATASSNLSALGITLQSKERELAALAGDKSELERKLAAQTAAAEEAHKQLGAQLAAAQAKVAEESRALAAARSEIESLTAQLAALKTELATKTAEAESQRSAAASKLAALESASASVKGDLEAQRAKVLQLNDRVFAAERDMEQAALDREAAETRESALEAQTARRIAQYEHQIASARSASIESGAKILALNEGVKDLRLQVSSLGQAQRTQAQQFLHQMTESTSFLVDSLGVQSTLLNTTMRKLKKEMSERRKLHNQVQELRGNIRVYCRARPLSKEEQGREGGSAITISQDHEAGEVASELLVRVEGAKGPTQKPFEFDAVFGPESTQGEVFGQIVSLVTSVLDGYSCCLFAYGQTGAGKTHTMMGSAEHPGMNLRSLTELFRLREERKDDVSYEITVSFYEVYNEELYDLLDKNKDKELKIRQGSTGVYVEGLVQRKVESEDDVINLMNEGNKNRTVGSTSMNAHSSRSHSILSVEVHGHSNVMGVQLKGTLHLIDLAGSERVGRSNATGDRLKEAQAINLSLSALGNCIEALQKKQSHVPFRNSKLTFILQNSLGGHSKCLMMVNVSPAAADVDETLCSLLFASRVRATELGTASKNVSSAPSASASSAEAGEGGAAAAKSPTAAAATAVKKAVAPGSAVKPRAAVGATATPIKKPLAAAAGSAIKKPAAK